MNKYVRIWSGEHMAWWREGGHGYTASIEDAGIFKYEEVKHLLGRSFADKMIRLDVAQPEYSI